MFALAALACTAAHAETPAPALCPVLAGGSPALGQIPAQARLAYIADRLHRSARDAQRWSLGWGSTYAVLTIGNLAVVPATADSSKRIDYYVSAASSAFGVLSQIVLMPREIRDARRLGALRGTPCARLAEAERLLLRDAADQAQGTGIIARAGSMAFNLGIGAILGFAFHRWETAAENTMAGIVIGEIGIAIRPAALGEDLRRYRAGLLAGPRQAPAWELAPALGLGGGPAASGGVGVVLRRAF